MSTYPANSYPLSYRKSSISTTTNTKCQLEISFQTKTALPAGLPAQAAGAVPRDGVRDRQC